MRESLVLVVVLSGLCFLSPSLTIKYVLVKNAVTWAEAQSDCRNKYIDMASVTNMEDLNLLNQLDQSKTLWIGLYGNSVGWKWSAEDQSSGEIDTGFRKWGPGENNGGPYYYKHCAGMVPGGNWFDAPCNIENPSLCYDGDPSNIVLVETLLSWPDARDNCRTLHTDLAFVKDQAANDQLSSLLTSESPWIGLYRDSWLWSDGSNVTITNWDTEKPDGDGAANCGASLGKKWLNDYCHNPHRYVCVGDPTEKKVVKVVVKKSDPSLDIVELQDSILEKLRERIAALNVDGEVTIKWRKQPDGSIFHKQIKEEEEGEKCPIP